MQLLWETLHLCVQQVRQRDPMDPRRIHPPVPAPWLGSAPAKAIGIVELHSLGCAGQIAWTEIPFDLGIHRQTENQTHEAFQLMQIRLEVS